MTDVHRITVETFVNASPQIAWDAFTNPQAITQWKFANADWTCPHARVDLRVGGEFSSRMEAKDGSMGFDFAGRYTDIIPLERIAYSMGDARDVVVEFRAEGEGTRVIETFVAENTFSHEQQRSGWQAILDNYRAFTEASAR